MTQADPEGLWKPGNADQVISLGKVASHFVCCKGSLCLSQKLYILLLLLLLATISPHVFHQQCDPEVCQALVFLTMNMF